MCGAVPGRSVCRLATEKCAQMRISRSQFCNKPWPLRLNCGPNLGNANETVTCYARFATACAGEAGRPVFIGLLLHASNSGAFGEQAVRHQSCKIL